MSSDREDSPASSPSNNHAPKYGTVVPNRVFVGGIGSNTTEGELQALFSKYGNVKTTKIIADRAGVSKGYGFVTFSCNSEAKKVQDEADNIYLKDRKLNIAQAIKKQPFNRAFDGNSPPAPSVICQGNVPYTYHNGMAFFTQTVDPSYSPCSPPQGTSLQMMYPQQYYVPQHYHHATNIVPQPAVPSTQWTRWPTNAQQTYCSYPHQYMSYSHPNAVIPSNLSSISQTPSSQASVSTPVNGGTVQTVTAPARVAQQPVQANQQQIQSAQSPLNYHQPCSPQIIPSPDAMNTLTSNGTQAMDYGYNQVPFHGISCFQLSSGMSDINEPCTPDNNQGTPSRSDSSLSQTSCSLSPSPCKLRTKPKLEGSSNFPKFSRSLAPKSVNGVSILAYSKGYTSDKYSRSKRDPFTPPPTPKTIKISSIPKNMIPSKMKFTRKSSTPTPQFYS